ILDLYGIGSLQREKGEKVSIPFVHGVELAGPRGETVRFRSVFDDGAMTSAIDENMYLASQGRLSALEPSAKVLRMADGRLVASAGVWRGWVTVKGASRKAVFEVFNSNNAWALLVGKPLLEAFSAVHDYSDDIIRIPQEAQWIVLENQF
ncbi:hypothetical protein BYT27DRAFT_7020408, partial [Phlegmacium glaucopus]